MNVIRAVTGFDATVLMDCWGDIQIGCNSLQVRDVGKGCMQISGVGDGASVVPRIGFGGFDAFYFTEYPAMLRLAIGLVDQRARAEELVQDAFERTLTRWERLENPGGFLQRVLVNAARSELRHRAVTRRVRGLSVSVVETGDADCGLLRALGRLTPRRRIAVALRFLEDRSEADVAMLMGCRVGTVKSLVSRGLADLREVVSP